MVYTRRKDEEVEPLVTMKVRDKARRRLRLLSAVKAKSILDVVDEAVDDAMAKAKEEIADFLDGGESG